MFLQHAFKKEFQIVPFCLTSSLGPVEKLVNAFVGTPVLDASTRYKDRISASVPSLNRRCLFPVSRECKHQKKRPAIKDLFHGRIIAFAFNFWQAHYVYHSHQKNENKITKPGESPFRSSTRRSNRSRLRKTPPRILIYQSLSALIKL